MAPQVNTNEQICVECSLCSFYWGDSCPGLKKFNQKDCEEM